MADEHYFQAVHEGEEKLLLFLRTFESVQENMHIEKIEESTTQNALMIFPTLRGNLGVPH